MSKTFNDPDKSGWAKEIRHDPLSSIGAIDEPTKLIIYGSGDPWVPAALSMDRLQELTRKHANFDAVVINGASLDEDDSHARAADRSCLLPRQAPNQSNILGAFRLVEKAGHCQIAARPRGRSAAAFARGRSPRFALRRSPFCRSPAWTPSCALPDLRRSQPRWHPDPFREKPVSRRLDHRIQMRPHEFAAILIGQRSCSDLAPDGGTRRSPAQNRRCFASSRRSICQTTYLSPCGETNRFPSRLLRCLAGGGDWCAILHTCRNVTREHPLSIEAWAMTGPNLVPEGARALPGGERERLRQMF